METTGIIVDFMKTQSLQVAVVFGAVAAINWMLRNKNAHIRYLLWLVVLVKCVTPPLVTFSLPILPAETVSPTTSVTTAVPSQSPTPYPVVEHQSNPVPVQPQPQIETFSPIENLPISHFHLTSTGVLLSAWAAGAACYIVWALIKAVLLQKKLRRQAKDLPDALAKQSLQLGAMWDQDLAFQVRLMDGIGQPFVWGLVRGSIYLPMNFETLEPEKRQSILMHEMAHVVRLDPLFNLMQILIQGLFWFHPLIWLSNRFIRQEREKCCDEAAIARLNTHPKEYGSAIVDALLNDYNNRIAAPSLAVAGPVKNIEDRIKTIMQPGKRFFRRPPMTAMLIIGILAAVIITTTIALTSEVTPPDYSLSGSVVGPNGNPIAGAIVFDDGYGPQPYQKGITDKNGKFEYKSWNEEHNVTAKAEGYQSQTQVFTTAPFDNSKKLNFKLQPGKKTDVKIETPSRTIPVEALSVREKERLAAMNQIRQATVACLLFAGDHVGPLPQKLEQLKPYLAENNSIPLDKMELLQPGRKIHEIKDVAATALLRMLLNDGKDGAIVAYCDGHVEYFSPERMKTPDYTDAFLTSNSKVQKRFFVTLIADKDNQINISGNSDSTIHDGQIEAVLAKLPEPEKTVLEIGFMPGVLPGEKDRPRWLNTNTVFQKAVHWAGKYKLEYLSFVGEDNPQNHRGSVSVRMKDTFAMDKTVVIGMPAAEINEDKSLLTVDSIAFTPKDGLMTAEAQMTVVSYPQRRWEITLRLYDKDGRQLASTAKIYQNSGIIPSFAVAAYEKLSFNLGEINTDTIIHFSIEVRRMQNNQPTSDYKTL